MKSKISIIVPVYKAEPYLRKCIDSILNQTFKEFELILVNDGSPDKSGEICDEYANKDIRIKVIHKKNGGQSSARNEGLNIAKGDYIGFVDSDDWLDRDMFRVLYENIIETGSDISICGTRDIKKQQDIRNQVGESKTIIYEDKNKIFSIMFSQNIFGWGPCNKLYKKNKIKNLRFLQGRIYEDVVYNLIAFSSALKVVSTSAKKYNYLQINSSTTRNEVTLKRLDLAYNILENYKILPIEYQKLWLRDVYKTLFLVIVEVVNEKTIIKNKEIFKSIDNILKENKLILKEVELEDKNQEIVFKFIKINSFIFALGYRILKDLKNIFRKKITRGNNVKRA